MPNVDDLLSGVQEARKRGFGDDEIMSHLAAKNPGFAQAASKGFGIDDVINHLAQKEKAGYNEPAEVENPTQLPPFQMKNNPNDPNGPLVKDLGQGSTPAFNPQEALIKGLNQPAQGVVQKALELSGVRPMARGIAELGAPGSVEPGKAALDVAVAAVTPALAALGVPGGTLARGAVGSVAGGLAGGLIGPKSEAIGSLLGGGLATLGHAPNLAESPQSALLKSLGGKPLPSADLPGPLGTIGQGMERLTETNPLTEWMVKPQKAANAQAIQNYVGEKAPTALNPTGFEGGVKLKDAVSKANDFAKGQYDAIMNEVQNIPTKTNIGKTVSKQLQGIYDTKGFIPEEAQDLIDSTSQKLKSVKTPGDYDNIIKEFNYNNQKILGENAGSPGVQGTLNHYFGQVNDILKQGHYDNLNSIQPGLGDQLRATNFDYANAKGELFGPFAKMAGGKVEDLPKKMLTAGQEFRDAAANHLGEKGYSTLQDEALGQMFRESMDKDGNLNAGTLQNLFGKKYKGMDWRPEQINTVKNTLGMMQKAGIGSLGAEIPSGIGAAIARMGNLLAPAWEVGHGNLMGAGLPTAVETAYTQLAPPALAGYRGAVGASGLGQKAQGAIPAMAGLGLQGMARPDFKQALIQSMQNKQQ